METTKVGKYVRVTQEERLHYYRDRISALTPPKTGHERSKIQVFEALIEYIEQTDKGE